MSAVSASLPKVLRVAGRWHAGVAIGLFVWAGSGFAETVGLWKLDHSATTGCNLRSLLNPTHDMLLSGSVTSAGSLGWELPPNPDATAALLDTPNNFSALHVGQGAFLRSPGFGPFVEPTNSFTVEGWLSRKFNPLSNSWHYVLGTRNSGDGWLFTLRMRDGLIRYELYSETCVSDGSLFDTPLDPGGTNVWHHLALVYDRSGGPLGRGAWSLFQDSVLLGIVTNYAAPALAINNNGNLFINGRLVGGGVATCYDYWRVSDQALTTNGFLNFPAPGVSPSPAPTLAYWKLGVRNDGFFDSQNDMGDAYALHGYPLVTPPPGYATTVKGSDRQAFAQVPNPTVPVVDNRGSAGFSTEGASLKSQGLGACLSLTNRFTVEGWIYRESNPAGFEYQCATRLDSKGWLLGLRPDAGTIKFYVYAEDDNDPKQQVPDVSFSATDEIGHLYEWRHVALTYDPERANGVWELFVNGLSCGTLTNARPVTVTSAVPDFYVGGRPGYSLLSKRSFDCWRACSEVLTSSRLMSATGGATSVPDGNVMALWPLNYDGHVFDGTSQSGRYSFTTNVLTTYRVLANPAQAVTQIPNPEPYVGFHGDPATNVGSITFYQPVVNNLRAFLQADNLGYALEITNSFTVEGWLCRTQNPGDWQHLFATRLGAGNPGWVLGVWLVSGKIRYNLFVGAPGTAANYVPDVKFPGSTDEASFLNVWQHVALVYDAELGNGVWELFVDGTSRGSVTNVRSVVELTDSSHFLLGGRMTSNNAFIGSMDCVRVSRVALRPPQFLNATGHPPQEPPTRTAAFWKLESDGASLDLTSQVESRYSLNAGALLPQPSSEQCRRILLNPDATEKFLGDPQTNMGSVRFLREDGTNRYLHVQNLGNRVELDRPFTVEGWFKRANTSGEPVQVLTGTRFDTAYGWTLTLEQTVAGPVLRLMAKTDLLEPLMDATFHCGDLLADTRWRHVAVVYKPWLSDKGGWELYLDGKSQGVAWNNRYPAAPHGSHRFMLGGRPADASFDGLLDCWRVSEGALTPAQFLYTGYENGTRLQLH